MKSTSSFWFSKLRAECGGFIRRVKMVENVYDLWQPSMFTTYLSQNRFKSFLPLGQFIDVQSQTWKWPKPRANPTQAISTRVAGFGEKVECNRTFWKISCCSWAMTAKKCTKKCATRAELLFCLLDLYCFSAFSLPSPSWLLKLPQVCNKSPYTTTTEVQAHPVAKFVANSSLDLP